MTRAAAVLALLSFSLVALAQSPADYAPKGGGFSVRFPGTPKETTSNAKSAVGELKVFTATYAASDGNTYLVSYTDFPAGTVRPDDHKAMLDGARDALRGKDGKVLEEKDTEVGPGKHAGRELELEKGKQRLRFRLVVRGDRLYQVAVVGSAGFASGKDAAAFLDSFDLGK